ncbi:MAG: COG1470 family protein, partial [Archangium sp.]
MPRVFDITATTSGVKLDASGQGEVSFTVSNKLGMGVNVRATVEPAGNARAEWMTFPDGMERVLSPDGTAVIPVRISVPQGTPPGSYSFGLVVASVSNPDEHYDRGPSVAFTVAPALAPVKKPFPWWLVAIAAGVLIIVGAVVGILSSHKAPLPALGQACGQKEPKCAANLTCGPANTCLGNSGFQGCDKPEQCVTGRCETGKCQDQVSLGDTCDSNDDCRAPLTCFQGFCLIPMGQKCTHPSQCVTGNCQNQACTQGAVFCPRCPL